MNKFKKIITTAAIISLLLVNGNGLIYAQSGPVPEATPEPVNPPQPVSTAVPATPQPAATPKPAATAKPAATPMPSIVHTPVPTPNTDQATDETSAPVTNEGSTGEVNEGRNTGVDSQIDTGDANTAGTITNTGNTNISAVNAGSVKPGNQGSSANVVNSQNADSTNNSASVKETKSTTTNQNNSATISNNMNQVSNSGDNVNSSNTNGDTAINTGNANNTGQIVNMVNTNAAGVMISEFNITDNHTGDYILDFPSNCIQGCAGVDGVANNQNGTNSANSTFYGSEENEATFQSNFSNIVNDMTLVSNTGNNETNRNTGGDNTINTGDANISAGVSNFVNNNFAGNVYLANVNIYGSLNGDILFPEGFNPSCCGQGASVSNSGNGAGSDNFASLNSSDDYIIEQANIADIENNVNITAQTGENKTERNTGGNNSIETGDANVLAQVINIANNNIVAGDFWLVIVNEAGNWVGKILGADDGAHYAASDGTDISVNSGGDITLENAGNGEDTANIASINQSTNTQINQDNNAKIVNNVNLNANTGGNSASRNTMGESSITTGDANVVLNIINFVNNNVVGTGRLFVTVVNVFGDWTGDYISPGQTASKDTKNDEAGNINEASEDKAIGGIGSSPIQSNAHDNKSSSTIAETPEEPQVLAMSTQNFTHSQTIKSNPTGKIASGETTEENNQELVATVNAAESDASSEGLNINLAWGLALVPLYFIIRIFRRKFTA